MRLVTFFLLNVLAFNVFAAEEPSDFEKGLRVLLELELNKFESCLDEARLIVMTLRWTVSRGF